MSRLFFSAPDNLNQIREHSREHPAGSADDLQVGGNARYLVEAGNADDVLATVEYARSNHLPLFVLGGGSNLVVSDADGRD